MNPALEKVLEVQPTATDRELYGLTHQLGDADFDRLNAHRPEVLARPIDANLAVYGGS